MKDLKYIIKRILIGVGIGIILMLFRSNVFAATINNVSMTPSNLGVAVRFGSTTWTSCNNWSSSGAFGGGGYKCSLSNTVNGDFYVMRINFTNVYNSYTNYNTFKFNLLLENAYLSGGYSIGNMASACSIESAPINDNEYTGVPSNTYPREYYGLNGYTITCNFNVMTSNSQLFLPIQVINNASIGIYLPTYWQAWNESDISTSINNQSTQQHQDAQQQHQDMQDINNSLNSDTTPGNTDTNNAYSNFENSTAQNGVITQLITLPVQLFTSISSNLNTSCTRFDLGTLMGTHIYFNCINPANYLGNKLWSVIDILASGFFVWYLAKKFIQVFENLSSMKEGDPVGD